MEINGNENYLIYPSGKVWSKASKRYLKAREHTAGYLIVNLNKDGKGKNHYIHRLLGEYFIQNPYNYNQIDHIDRNRKNNKLNNLRWVSASQNQHNTNISKNNTIGVKNISIHNKTKLYIYEKMINGNIHKKYFRTLEEAIQYKINYEKNM